MGMRVCACVGYNANFVFIVWHYKVIRLRRRWMISTPLLQLCFKNNSVQGGDVGVAVNGKP